MYYLLGRVWVLIAGHSELALRLFSTAGMIFGVLLLWIIARKQFSTVAVAWSMALVYLFASGPRWQELNGRFYGLFFFAVVLTSFCFMQAATRKLTPRELLLTTLAHALLVGSHMLGLIYSFGLIAGLFAMDHVLNRTRWKLYLSAFAGWSILAVAFHGIYRSSSIAKGRFWTSKPAHHEFLVGLTAFNPVLLKLMAALLGFVFLKLVFQHRLRLASAKRLGTWPTLWLCLSLFFAQIVLFMKSQFGLSIYADRYLLPLTTVTVLVFAACFDELLVFKRILTRPGSNFACSLLVFVPICAYAARQNDLAHLYPRQGLPQRMSAQLEGAVPVLVTYMPDFTLMSKYDTSRPYYFLLDWSYDLEPSRADRSDYSAEREMENWRRANLLPGRIINCPEFFSRNEDFYVFLGPGREDWMKARLLHNRDLSVSDLGRWEEWGPYTLYRVRRIHPGASPC